jgi:exodeoxyribonuclease V alpha subunit
MTAVAITRILSDRDSGVILAARLLSDEGSVGSAIQVKALRRVLMGCPAVGEVWEIDGPVVETRWGPQIEATRAVRTLPSGELVRTYLAEHVPGIGRERASRLWAAYGPSLAQVLLAGDLDAIGAVLAPDRPLLGPRIAAAAVRAWKDRSAEADLVTWLGERGVNDMRVARKVHAVLGEHARETLERNPWCLVSLLSWKQVDDLGMRLSREANRDDPEDAPERLVGAVDAAVKHVIGSGATAVSTGDLRTLLAANLHVSAEHPRVAASIAAGTRNGAILAGENGIWSAPGCALMEDAVVAKLRGLRLIETADQIHKTAFDFVGALAAYERISGALHPEQRKAVLQIFRSPFACLQGGAGVGKTHVTRAICHVWEETGGDVVLAALAGKAALRLARSTGRLARTLFRTVRELDERVSIEDRLSGGVEPDEAVRLKARLRSLAKITPRSLVIADEASMIDLATMYALLRRMPVGARLLLVGDERQLSPVGFGLVFHPIVADESVTARLTVVHRQSSATGIPAVSASIRERQLPRLDQYQGLRDGVSILETSGASGISQAVLEVYGHLKGSDPLVVAPTKAGPSGTRALNDALHERHVSGTGTKVIVSPLGTRFAVGDPVVHGRNDYSRGLFNGSMGLVTAVGHNALSADIDGEHHEFSRDSLLDLELGYALTCHRAQGSQAERVIVALTPSRLLDPSWIYTAITRAERQVIIIGAMQTMVEALGRSWASQRRRVGLKWH